MIEWLGGHPAARQGQPTTVSFQQAPSPYFLILACVSCVPLLWRLSFYLSIPIFFHSCTGFVNPVTFEIFLLPFPLSLPPWPHFHFLPVFLVPRRFSNFLPTSPSMQLRVPSFEFFSTVLVSRRFQNSLSVSPSIHLPVSNSSLPVLYPAALYIFFLRLPLSISLALFVSSCPRFWYTVAFRSPAPCFCPLFLAKFLLPYHFRIFPSSLSCLCLLVLLVPPTSLPCFLSLLFIPPSLCPCFFAQSLRSPLSTPLSCSLSLSGSQHPVSRLPVPILHLPLSFLLLFASLSSPCPAAFGH